MNKLTNIFALVFVLGATAAYAADPVPPPAEPAIQYKTKKLNRAQLDALLARPAQLQVIDLRRPDELTKIGGLPVYLSIQMQDLEKSLDYISRERNIITVSNHAGRALKAGDLLDSKGFYVAGAVGVQNYEEEGGTLTKVVPPEPKPATPAPAASTTPAAPPAPPAARGPGLALALEAAQEALATCTANGYKAAVSVVDSDGVLKAFVAADGASQRGVESSKAKAYTSIAFKIPSAAVAKQAEADPVLLARLSADPKHRARAGALPLFVGKEVIGAIGVGGAPGGDKDEACALAGLEKIKDRLQ